MPPQNKRHVDRWCLYLVDKPDIHEFSEQEIAEHEGCLVCAG
jgi:hypothetical protein